MAQKTIFLSIYNGIRAKNFFHTDTYRELVKDKNLRRDSRVALSILDPENPYRYIAILGEVVEITQTGADEHIDKLAKRYLGKDKYPYHRPGEARVIYKIRPDKVSTHI